MRWAATLNCIVTLALCASSATGAPRRLHDGTYGKISHSAQTGDRDGVQLTLHLTPKVATVSFLMCEGGCDEVVKATARPVGDGLAFDVIERYVDVQGRPTSSVVTQYLIEPDGSGLRLSASGGRIYSNVYLPPAKRLGL
jgi:hypothetical protein